MCRRGPFLSLNFSQSGKPVHKMTAYLSSARRHCADVPKTGNKESHALKEEVDVVSLLRVKHVIATT
jgi:hypothetical protein